MRAFRRLREKAGALRARKVSSLALAASGSTRKLSFSKGSPMTSFDTEDEAPLDAAAARLRRKLVRLLFVSGGIMILGFIAVFAAIVYKLNERSAASQLSAASPVESRIVVPPGYRVLATALDGDRALLTLAAPDGSTTLLLVDLASGATLGRYAVEPGR